MEPQQTNASSDERVFALVCHLSMFFGAFVVPLIVYFIQKDKSKFAAFNALQAVYFHITYFIFIILFYGIVFLVVGFDPESNSRGEDLFSGSSVTFIILFVVLFIALIFYFIIYAIVTAIKSYQGYIKKYPMVGNIAYRQVYES